MHTIRDIRRKYGYEYLCWYVGTGTPELQKRLLQSVERAWDQGIVVLAAAGNNGPGEHTVTSPGISKKIITVGSLDSCSETRRELSLYSGRGRQRPVW